ncbi:hypothetical protein UFOVP957_12 [uncultured Caudovirales phage]|uniref:Uncharacterized protein n=1 Tax=uncultured Caudovirales phage TaxID=2100421 RepID=A0A6J5LPA6_9CAUD|nr:hypothetical protein UFOVP283_36 [uncultured Caudovirales phage]CAB4173911.1 hypothetical protein UFOVP957_12 [uncultured Caudovirales phage]CAB4192377.1 hypothetical protein UFOVP1231_27 [uncultured Caudovirales phage]
MSAIKGYPKVTGTWAKHQGEWVISIAGLDSTEEVLEVTVVTKAGVASKKFIRPAYPVGHKNGSALYAICLNAGQGKAPVEKIAAPRGYEKVVRTPSTSEARPAHNRGTAWEREFDCDYAI